MDAILATARDLSASGGLPSWIPLFLGGIGSTICLLALPALSRWIKNWRLRRTAQHEAPILADSERITKQGERIAVLETSMGRVLTFIEGTEDPFTHETQGGLVNTLKQILEMINKEKTSL